MDDSNWELHKRGRSVRIGSGPGCEVAVVVQDPSDVAQIELTPDEACRIALELLRRVGGLDHLTVRELGGVFDRAPISEMRARHIPVASTG